MSADLSGRPRACAPPGVLGTRGGRWRGFGLPPCCWPVRSPCPLWPSPAPCPSRWTRSSAPKPPPEGCPWALRSVTTPFRAACSTWTTTEPLHRHLRRTRAYLLAGLPPRPRGRARPHAVRHPLQTLGRRRLVFGQPDATPPSILFPQLCPRLHAARPSSFSLSAGAGLRGQRPHRLYRRRNVRPASVFCSLTKPGGPPFHELQPGPEATRQFTVGRKGTVSGGSLGYVLRELDPDSWMAAVLGR